MEACNEFVGPISASLRSEQHSFFWRNVKAVANHWRHCAQFASLRFEPQTSRSRDERITIQPILIQESWP